LDEWSPLVLFVTAEFASMDSRLKETALARLRASTGAASPAAPSPTPQTTALAPVSIAVDSHPPAGHNDTLFPLIWRQRALVLTCTVLGTLIAAFYVHFATPLYTTEARIIVARSSPLIGDGEAAAMGDNFLNTQCELIKSSPILALAISHVDADNLQLFSGVHNRISFLKNNLDVNVAKHSDIIDVDMETPYPDDAKKVVDAAVNAFEDFQRRQMLSTDGQMLSILQHEKDKRDAELDAKTKELNDLRMAQNAAGAGDDSAGITMQRLSTLSSALTAAQLDTLTAKSAYLQAAKSAGIDTTDPNWIDKNEADVSQAGNSTTGADEDSIRARLFDLQQQMSTLRRQYLPGHPAIQALQSHIDELNAAIVGAVRQRWLTAQSHEQEIQASFDAQQKIAFAQSARNGDLERVSSEVRRLQDLSDSLDKRIKELSLASQAGSLHIQMVDEAANSDDPTFPRAIHLLPLGFLAGAALGIGLGLIRETSGLSLNLKSMGGGGTSGKTMIGLPVFASVPRQGEISIKHVAWSSHLRPESTIAVAFRALRDALQASSAAAVDLVAPRTIMVASPMNGEGRTITASNLAITLAKSGKRVCLVDADLRQPSLAKVFAVRDDSGLTNVISGIDPLTKAIQRTVIERLDLLTAGPPVDDPAELLNAPQFAETMEDLTLKYDHIVLDSSSVLGAPDARIVAASCDATLLLLSQEGTSKRVAEQCRDGLIGVGATVIGIVANSAPKRAQQRGKDDRNDRNRSVRKPTASLPEPARSEVPQLPLSARARHT
jgi:succinoglycan biosynthesis transport protein ExoP